MIDIDVLIVGAGFGGLATAMQLQRQAPDVSFALIERAAGVGGTWRDNVYPGIACDVPAPLYCFRDAPEVTWSRKYAPGAEIRRYLERVARDRDLMPSIHLATPMRRAKWREGAWAVDTGGAKPPIRAQNLVLACGRLTEPKLPDIDGLRSFLGPVMHTARWDTQLDVAGKCVAVVGTGASAIQIVPALVAAGASVTLFQRTPAWIMPREDREYDADEHFRWRSESGLLADLRASLLAEGEARFASRSGDVPAAAAARRRASNHLRTQVPDVRLRRALTPRYPFGCKRVLLSDDFYPAISSGAVLLEPSALTAVSGGCLVAASGARHRADVLVMATGFETTRQPYADLVEGEHGETLAEHWSMGMTSVGSTMVAGFPDLYILNGPNAALGHNSSVLMLEEQARFISRRIGDRTRPARVTQAAEERYTREIVRRSAGTPWLDSGCKNWYVDERSGRLTLLWPGTVAEYAWQLDHIRESDFEPESLLPATTS